MARLAQLYLASAVVVGCKPALTAKPTAPPSAIAQPAAVNAPTPATYMRDLPKLSGSLPSVPDQALRVTVRAATIALGNTNVAALRDGQLDEEARQQLARAMTIAGSPNRPVAIFALHSSPSRAVVDIVNTAHASGSHMVGLAANVNGGTLGWIPVHGATLHERGIPAIQLDTAQESFGGFSDTAWEAAGGVHRMVVSVDAEMRAQPLYAALHELRGSRCATEPGACRFAALGLTNERIIGTETQRAGVPLVTTSEQTARYNPDGTRRDTASDAELIGLRSGSAGSDGAIALGNSGGIGIGSGAGLRAGGRVPRIRQGKAAITSGLDKDIVRRIVRAHINEVRHCYNDGLAKDPDLAGRVEVWFRISNAGRVEAAKVASNTVPDASVGQCVAKAVKRWSFPKPRGHVPVVVTYPFVLEPG